MGIILSHYDEPIINRCVTRLFLSDEVMRFFTHVRHEKSSKRALVFWQVEYDTCLDSGRILTHTNKRKQQLYRLTKLTSFTASLTSAKRSSICKTYHQMWTKMTIEISHHKNKKHQTKSSKQISTTLHPCSTWGFVVFLGRKSENRYLIWPRRIQHGRGFIPICIDTLVRRGLAPAMELDVSFT